MNEHETEKILKAEISKAEAMQAAYNTVLEPFFRDKHEQLFAAFTNCKVGDTDALEAVHYASKALMSLNTEVQAVIDSGKIATAQMERAKQAT